MSAFSKVFWAILVILMISGVVFAGSIECAGVVSSLDDLDGSAMAKKVAEQLGGNVQAWVFFGYERQKGDNKTKDGLLADAVKDIRSVVEAPLVGCWTQAGVFACRGGKAVISDALLVGLKADGVQFSAAMEKFGGPGNFLKASKSLAEKMQAKNGKGVVLLITDSRPAHDGSYPMAKMYEVMQDVWGPKVGLVGGNTSYMSKPVFYNDTVTSMGLVGLMMSGDVDFKIIVEPGKVAISEPLTITKLGKPNEIVELNGRDWIEVYRERLDGYMPAEKFDAAIEKGGGAFGGICRQYPYALVKEHGQLYVRLAHGLSPWGQGRKLPSEAYDLTVGEQMVVTKVDEEQLSCLRRGMRRLRSDMPAGKRLFMLFPCESNGFLAREKKGDFLKFLEREVGSDDTAFGFFPCGEHASWYEPQRDERVIEGRYHQLSYPMSVIVAR